MIASLDWGCYACLLYCHAIACHVMECIQQVSERDGWILSGVNLFNGGITLNIIFLDEDSVFREGNINDWSLLIASAISLGLNNVMVEGGVKVKENGSFLRPVTVSEVLECMVVWGILEAHIMAMYVHVFKSMNSSKAIFFTSHSCRNSKVIGNDQVLLVSSQAATPSFQSFVSDFYINFLGEMKVFFKPDNACSCESHLGRNSYVVDRVAKAVLFTLQNSYVVVLFGFASAPH
eukprot:3416155-Ditylum_brightwellii.AAC.2